MSNRKARYLKRKEKRENKRKEKLEKNLKFENVCSYESLYKAAHDSANGVRWKESVQRYSINVLVNIAKTQKDLLKNKDIRQGFIEFVVMERGKLRYIRSVHFRERVIQKSLCQNALGPVLTHNLINDNGASQKGKGTLFATQRLVKTLVKHYNKYGNSGYVLLIDFKSYFDSILHDVLKNQIKKYFTDEKIIKYSNDFIDAFGEIGLGLGSETSQIEAVAYINEIDHYIKEVTKIKGYGRYMDDSYLVHPSKEFLEKLLEDLKGLYLKYGIHLNEKKTYISDLKHGFTFLKTRFYLTDSGKIIKKPCRKSITRQRRKMKKQSKLLDQGVLTKQDTKVSFDSWVGSVKRKNARKTIYSMRQLYKNLFENERSKKDD